jgi:hypothetical protein
MMLVASVVVVSSRPTPAPLTHIHTLLASTPKANRKLRDLQANARRARCSLHHCPTFKTVNILATHTLTGRQHTCQPRPRLNRFLTSIRDHITTTKKRTHPLPFCFTFRSSQAHRQTGRQGRLAVQFARWMPPTGHPPNFPDPPTLPRRLCAESPSSHI